MLWTSLLRCLKLYAVTVFRSSHHMFALSIADATKKQAQGQLASELLGMQRRPTRSQCSLAKKAAEVTVDGFWSKACQLSILVMCIKL